MRTTRKTRETLRALGVLPAVDFCKQPEGTPVVYSPTYADSDVYFVEMSDFVIGMTMSIEPAVPDVLIDEDDYVTEVWS